MRKVFVIFLLVIKRFRDPYYQGAAAQIAFYYALSIVPIFILISQVLGSVFNESIEDAVGWLLNLADEFGFEELDGLLSYQAATVTNVIFLIVLIWSASKAQFSLMRISNYTLSEGESTGEGYVRDRIRSMLNMGFTLISVVIAIVVLVYGQQIINLILEIFDIDEGSVDLWLFIRWPIAFALYFFMVLFNYYSLPTKKRKIKYFFSGAIFASLGIVIATYVYSIYIDKVANYDILYGSLASMAGLLMWFYILAWVLFLGIIVSKAWDEYGKSEMGVY